MEPGAARPCRARLSIAARDLVRGHVVVDALGERTVERAVWTRASEARALVLFTDKTVARYAADLMVEVLAP